MVIVLYVKLRRFDMYSKNVIYKKRTVSDKYCVDCKTFLTGNGSLVYPHKCDCGVYVYDWKDSRYKIQKP